MLHHKLWEAVGVAVIAIAIVADSSSNGDGNSTERSISHLSNEGDNFYEVQQNARESFHVPNAENTEDNSLESNDDLKLTDDDDDDGDGDDDSQFVLEGLRNNLMYLSNASWTNISELDVNSVQNCTTCSCLCLWLSEVLIKYDYLRTKVSLALYEKNINITSQNEMMLVKAEREFHSLKIRISNEIESSEFHPNSLMFNCGSRVRNFIGILKIKDYLKPSNLKEATTFQAILTSMKNKHSTTIIRRGNKTLHLTPDLTKIMTSSRNYFELLWAWKAWHDSSGSRIKDNFTDLVKLQNKSAKQKGYSNAKDIWKYMGIGGVDASQAMIGLMNDIKPLYEQLHAFVRARLVQYYSHQLNGTSHRHVLNPDGPIPAHILGDMYAQDWSAIEDIVLPFPNHSLPNITGALIEQKYNVRKMFQLAEDFFISLGFQPMTNLFWNKSVIERPPQHFYMNCHPSSYDIGAKDDFRIKMCGQVDAKNLEIIHHEMGHIVDFMEQRHLPVLLRQSIFKEATGDTIALSVMSQTHLQSIGLIDRPAEEDRMRDLDLQDLNVTEIDINFLMRQALTKVCFLPFAFSLELWRYEVLENNFNSSDYNSQWWEIRRRYQGVVPPENRNSDKFDPGAKYHIAANYAYSGYFLSYVAQFQFHEALCKEANHSGPLHTCDIYASERAGRKLRSLLRKGSSVNWEELMSMMTGQGRFNSSALLQYFDPLYRWLLRANQINRKGW